MCQLLILHFPTFHIFHVFNASFFALSDVDPEILMTAVGSLINLMTSCGEFLAPALAGCLYDALGFQWTMTVGGLLSLFTGSVLLTALIKFGNGDITLRRSSGKTKEESAVEKETLLTQNDVSSYNSTK